MLHDNKRELFSVERRYLFEWLYELEHVVPLAVENELPEEDDIIGELRIDHACLAFQVELRNVQVVRMQELNDHFDYIAFG